jgi:NADH-quinone oxidoreductase subunit C
MADSFEKGLSDLESGPQATGGSGPERGVPTDVEHPSVTALRDRFGDAILHHELHAGDEHVVFIAPERNVEILRWLHGEPDQRYDLLIDLTAVDFGGGRPLQVVYQLWSIPHKRALRLKAELPLHALEIESVVGIWSTANWLEREVYDLFGIQFRGHPDLRRILMPDNYAEGHPLRKDFPLRGRFSRAEQTRRALSFDLADYYTRRELSVMDRPQQQHAQSNATGSVDFPEDLEASRDPRDEGRTGEDVP